MWQLFESLGAPEARERILQDNVFVERLLPLSVVRDLSRDEWDAYREPFPDAGSRRPILAFRSAVGSPGCREVIGRYTAWLRNSDLPKLMLHFTPGAIGNDLQRRWVEAHLPRTTVVDGGIGIHFVQEDEPDVIGRAITSWMEAEGLARGGPGS